VVLLKKHKVQMKIHSRIFRSLLCLTQAGFLVSGNVAVFAATGLSTELIHWTNKFFGDEHTSDVAISQVERVGTQPVRQRAQWQRL